MTDTHQPAQNAIEKASIENGSVHSYLSAPCVVRGIKMLLHAPSDNVKLKWTRSHVISATYRWRQFASSLSKAALILCAFDVMAM